jgi:hypothetical protein
MSTFKIYLLIGALMMMCPGLSQAQECQKYRDLIEKHLPSEVGDSIALKNLLSVKPDNWMAELKVDEVLKTLKDDLPEQQFLDSYPISVMRSDHSIMKYNLVKGELRYINRNRDFVLDNARAFNSEMGLKIVNDLLSALGLPLKEIGKIEGRVLKGGTVRYATKIPSSETKHDVETIYFISRIINGIPELTSVAIAAVSNSGEISRFRVRWPVLNVDPGLRRAEALSRKEVADTVYKAILENEDCTGLERFGAYLAYVPESIDTQDDDKIPDEAKAIVHVPKLVVFYRTLNPEESGQELLFDLFK